MAAGRLILVAHAPLPSGLDDRAREDCVLLAHALAEIQQPLLWTSPRPVPRQTADVLGLRLGAWPVDDPALTGTSAAAFDAAVARAVSASASSDVVIVASGHSLASCLRRIGFRPGMPSVAGQLCAIELDPRRHTVTTLFPVITFGVSAG